ncbi:MAG: hypothetical protein VB142_09185 [Burkholderia sp.]
MAAFEPGVSVAKLAREHGLNAKLAFRSPGGTGIVPSKWRQRQRCCQ